MSSNAPTNLDKLINCPKADGTGLNGPKEVPSEPYDKGDGIFSKRIRVPFFYQKKWNLDAFWFLRLAVSIGSRTKVMWFDPFFEGIADSSAFDISHFRRFVQKINVVCKSPEFAKISTVTFEFVVMTDYSKSNSHWLDTRNHAQLVICSAMAKEYIWISRSLADDVERLTKEKEALVVDLEHCQVKAKETEAAMSKLKQFEQIHEVMMAAKNSQYRLAYLKVVSGESEKAAGEVLAMAKDQSSPGYLNSAHLTPNKPSFKSPVSVHDKGSQIVSGVTTVNNYTTTIDDKDSKKKRKRNDDESSDDSHTSSDADDDDGDDDNEELYKEFKHFIEYVKQQKKKSKPSKKKKSKKSSK